MSVTYHTSHTQPDMYLCVCEYMCRRYACVCVYVVDVCVCVVDVCVCACVCVTHDVNLSLHAFGCAYLSLSMHIIS